MSTDLQPAESPSPVQKKNQVHKLIIFLSVLYLIFMLTNGGMNFAFTNKGLSTIPQRLSGLMSNLLGQNASRNSQETKVITTPCARYKTITACDYAQQHGESCSWYMCKNVCLTTGTDTDTVCNDSIKAVETASLPTPSPELPTPPLAFLKPPKTTAQIGWDTYNGVFYKNVTYDKQSDLFAFSLKFPDPGDLCNGCIDGWPYNAAPINVNGTQISGGNFNERNAGAWNLVIGRFYPNIQQENSISNALYDKGYAKFFAALESMSVNSSGSIPFEIPGPFEAPSNVETFRATRLENTQVLGQPAKQFILIDKNNIRRQYALVNFPSFTLVIIYSYSDPVYNVFDKILSSFSYELFQKPSFGPTVSDYLKMPQSMSDPSYNGGNESVNVNASSSSSVTTGSQ